jgi:eukaryotic-like serine/threonine-protein kinase
MQSLQDYVARHLPEHASQEIREHLDFCETCATNMAFIESQFLGPTESSNLLDESSSEPVAPTEVLGTDRPTIAPRDSARFDFDLLEPIESAESLGRLGNYEIQSVLGHGGMGVVFLAYDERLCRRVAIKTLNRQLATSATARRRFIREARAAAAINHPNVVTIHGVEEFADQPFLVMEFLSDGTLSDRLRREGRLTPIEALRLSTQIAAGLAAAHAQGVIHRDVKPGNIMLEDGLDRVRISDFGLARVTLDNMELTSRDLTVGTPAYMAPEQVAGEDVDARTDLFALGCVMYAMLTGHSPFQGNHAVVMAHKISEYDPPPLDEANQRVPNYFSKIVTRLLEKDPKDRYQSAKEVADLLCEHLAAINQTPTDGEGTAAYPHAKRIQRRPSIGTIVGSILLLAAISSGVVWFMKYKEQQNPKLPIPPGRVGIEAHPVTVVSKTLTVAQDDPKADYRSIGAALTAAGTDTVIQILDDGVYDEGLLINRADKWAGVKIVGTGPQVPTLTAKGTSLITIRATPRVILRNLKLRPSTDSQHAIAVSGLCPDVWIDDVDIAVDESFWAMVYITESACGYADRPIRLSNCRVESPYMGVVIQGDQAVAASNIEITNNIFAGDGVHLQLNEAVRSTEIRGNVFQGGNVAVALGLRLPDLSSDVLLVNNTFWANQCWLHVRDSSPLTRDVRFVNNLILRSDTDAIGSDLHTVSLYLDRWSFQKNQWECKTRPDDDDWLNNIATFHTQIDLLSIEPTDDLDYLRIPADSPLATAGVNGDMPSYVGAFPPKGVSTRSSD